MLDSPVTQLIQNTQSQLFMHADQRHCVRPDIQLGTEINPAIACSVSCCNQPRELLLAEALQQSAFAVT